MDPEEMVQAAAMRLQGNTEGTTLKGRNIYGLTETWLSPLVPGPPFVRPSPSLFSKQTGQKSRGNPRVEGFAS